MTFAPNRVDQQEHGVRRGNGIAAPNAGPNEAASTGLHDAREAMNELGALRVAYFTNQYPKVSHSFIRREILAAERLGVTVVRFALRGWDAEVVDPQDIEERERTRYVLKDGLLPLFAAMLGVLARRPQRFFQALKAALAMSRKSVRPLPYHIIYLAHACRMLGWLSEARVSHLHAHFGTNTAEIALLIRLLGGPPYSFTVHGMDEADNARFLSFGRKIGGAKFAAAISAFTRSQLMRHIPPEDWNKVKVIHCGLEQDFFAADQIEPRNPSQFLCIGRLSEEKGHFVLLEAFSRLLGAHPGARLVIAGDGALRTAIEGRIRRLGLERHVHITGWVTSGEVRNTILSSRALVQPSLQEGLPVVIMEAMALGRPVISTFVAGIPELVRPSENGWLVPAGDALELTNAMQCCLETPDGTLRRMGAAALQRVRSRHHADVEAAKLVSLFASGATVSA